MFLPIRGGPAIRPAVKPPGVFLCWAAFVRVKTF